jgi:cytoskeletal protein CcmA (bactofilin family)
VDASVIGKDVVIEGGITGHEDLVFHGRIHGTVQLPGHRFTLGATGRADIAVEAKHVIVAGHLTGDVTAERVELRATGAVIGKVVCQRISIEDGGVIRGEINAERPANTANAADLQGQLAIK